MKSYRRRIQPAGPPRPGEILRDLYLEPLGISVLEAAKDLSITEAELYLLLRGKMSVTPPFAGCLAVMFNTTPIFWLNLQTSYNTADKNGI